VGLKGISADSATFHEGESGHNRKVGKPKDSLRCARVREKNKGVGVLGQREVKKTFGTAKRDDRRGRCFGGMGKKGLVGSGRNKAQILGVLKKLKGIG